jgi:type I restriction enzyme S subunit
MASEWESVALGEICELRSGCVFKPSLQGRRRGDYPFVKVSDMNLPANAVRLQDANNWVDEGDLRVLGAKPLPSGAVVFAKIGEALRQNRLRQVGRATIADNNMMGAVPRTDRVDPRFFYYALSQFDFSDIAQGTALPYLTVAALSRLTLRLPPLPEQRMTGLVLGALDDKIELNRRVSQTLESMARALFKSWFIDFDPVRAKAEGRDPGVPAHVDDLFPNSFEPSALGEIPTGWGLQATEDLAERIAMGPFGSSIKVSTFVPEGIPVISGQHLRGALLDDGDFNFVSVEHAERLRRSNVQRGDVVFTHAGSIGQAAYIPETARYERYIISQRQFYMRCDATKVSPLFVMSYFQSSEGRRRLLANTSSTGVPSISQPVSYLRQLRLVTPPQSLMQAFHSVARSLYEGMAANARQSRALGDIRDELLPRLMTGAARVGESPSRPQVGQQSGCNSAPIGVGGCLQ